MCDPGLPMFQTISTLRVVKDVMPRTAGKAQAGPSLSKASVDFAHSSPSKHTQLNSLGTAQRLSWLGLLRG